jgi:hypothetical protein
MQVSCPYLYNLLLLVSLNLLVSCGGGGGSDEPQPNLESENRSPSLTLDVADTFPENKSVIGEVQASDPDNDNISIELSGDDASSFALRQTTLFFKFAPDFENPTDLDKNNIYLLDITASDGDLSATRALELQIFNVDEVVFDEAEFDRDVLE